MNPPIVRGPFPRHGAKTGRTVPAAGEAGGSGFDRHRKRQTARKNIGKGF